MNFERKKNIIAAAVTFVVVLLLLLLLWFGKLGSERRDLASASIPEPTEEEELFIEPELIDLGEEEAITEVAPSPSPQGTPEVSEDKTEQVVVKGESPKPAPPKEKLNTQREPSPVKATEPKQTEKEPQTVKDPTAGAFSPNNGRNDGKNGASGVGGTSTGVSGYADGREFVSCPAPKVQLRNRTVVKVSVTVEADGRVSAAKAVSGGDASLRSKCEQAALKARWKAKEGARPTKGTITFTIIPA